MLVAPHTTQDDIILLASLERIHTRHLDLLVQILLHRSVELHVVDDVGALSFVRGDDTDLRWSNAGLEELGDDLLDVRGFRPGSEYQRTDSRDTM